jgi:hypothetical protein
MRTKTLLIAAAALAAGIMASSAQTYSANIVGYVTQVLPVGLSLITCPVNSTNTGLSVPANQCLQLQVNDAVILWNGAGYSTYTYLNAGVGLTWIYPDGSFSDTAPTITLGTGFFYSNGQTTPETNTFAGTVVLTNSVSLPVGLTLVGSTPPIGGAVTNTATFNLPLQVNDALVLWNGSGYSTYTYLNAGAGLTWIYPDGSFSDVPPNLSTAAGVFYSNGQTSSETWSQNLIVQ